MVVTDQGVYQNRFSSTEIHTFSKGPICSIFTRPLTRLERATKRWQWTRWVEIRLATSWFHCYAAEFRPSGPWWRKKSCFAVVLLLVDPGNVEYSSCEPFLFDIIEFFAESNIPENKRLFTLICNDFSWLMHFIVVLLSTPKLEILQHKSESW